MAFSPLWELCHFLGEEWIHEDAVNGMFEILYFWRAATSLSPATSNFLSLSTHFYADASYIFSIGPRLYSKNLLALRRRVAATDVAAIGFLILIENHFSAVWIDGNGVFFADSLSHLPPDDLLPILRCKVGNDAVDIVCFASSQLVRAESDLGANLVDKHGV